MQNNYKIIGRVISFIVSENFRLHHSFQNQTNQYTRRLTPERVIECNFTVSW